MASPSEIVTAFIAKWEEPDGFPEAVRNLVHRRDRVGERRPHHHQRPAGGRGLLRPVSARRPAWPG
jgi:hypothetical protein